MSKRVCPWWIGYLLASPLRRFAHDPVKILSPYVREGMTVLEPGPGMGFFTLDLLRMVGDSGRVIAVDVQNKMIERLKQRATKAGLSERLDARLVGADTMGISDLNSSVDLTLAFAVVHELPSEEKFFSEVAHASKTGAVVLLAEPRGHVNTKEFEKELAVAATCGFSVTERPSIPRSHAAVLGKA